MRWKRILKKLGYVALTIFFVLVFNYALFRLLPGSFLTNLSRASRTNARQLEYLRAFYGLDKTWYEQFFGYLKNLFTGNLGTSFSYGKPVWDVIKTRILPTVILLGVAEVIAFALGLFFGVAAAWKRGKAVDTALLSGSLVFYSMPTFWLAMLLILVFCTTLGWFPAIGMATSGKIFMSAWSYIKDVSNHMVLPVLCMAVGMAGEYCITMRSTMIDVLSEDYITTARAKGFREGYVLRKHALPNAMLPMTTLVAMNLGLVVAGAVQLETMFSWPGLGSLTYYAIDNRDYTLLQGLFLLITVSIILANFISDILYELIDPRVKS